MFDFAPLHIRIILITITAVIGGFCIYGLLGLRFKEEEISFPRRTALSLCKFIAAAFVFFLLACLIPPSCRSDYDDRLEEERQKGYEDGYYDGYNEGYKFGYEGGYEDGYLEEDYNDDPF